MKDSLTTISMKIVNESDILYYKDQLIIYRIYHIDSNKSYIGKCSKGLSRILDHLKAWKNPKQDYRAKLLYRAMRKYGIDSFDYEILYTASDENELNLKEKYYIEKFKTLDRNFGYNLTEGGTGGNTWGHLTPEDLLKAKERLRKSNKKFWKKDPRAKELRKILSNNLKEMRKDPTKNQKNREIAKKRLSELNKTDPRFLAARENRKKPVICVETGEIFKSIKEAALKLNVHHWHVQNSIKKNKPINKLNLSFRLYKKEVQ
jgi:group I intron endonuclease